MPSLGAAPSRGRAGAGTGIGKGIGKGPRGKGRLQPPEPSERGPGCPGSAEAAPATIGKRIGMGSARARRVRAVPAGPLPALGLQQLLVLLAAPSRREQLLKRRSEGNISSRGEQSSETRVGPAGRSIKRFSGAGQGVQPALAVMTASCSRALGAGSPPFLPSPGFDNQL